MTETEDDKELIAFIDDDAGAMELYHEELEAAGYRVERFYDLPSAIAYIQTTTDKPSMWIVDVMMPVIDEFLRIDGELVSKLASRGLASGRVLYQQIRRRFPTSPLMLLTSVPDANILNALEAEMDRNAICEAKIAVLPSELPGLVEERIRETLASSAN